jgi:hypothetical protein
MQAEFIAKLARREEGLPARLVSCNSDAPENRFNLYRNNVFVGLIDTLRARYPAVARLVGEEFFAPTARLYAAAHPPQSPALFEYGGGFADFLQSFEPARSLIYLPDVARIEWLRHQAYHAPNLAPMKPGVLAAIPAEQIGRVVLRLHPSAGLLTSDYPAFSIWQTNSRDEEVRKIDPEAEGEAVLVLRPELEVVIMRLGPGGDVFLKRIQEGACLADAVQSAEQAAAEFSLAEALGAFLANGAFSGFSLAAESISDEGKYQNEEAL